MMGTRFVRSSVLAVAAITMVAAPAALRAQPAAESPRRSPPPVAAAARAQGPISVDGRLDETAWQRAAPITDFRQFQPEEGEPASLPMEVRILFDDGALYIGARMTQPGGVAAPLARRDQLLDASGDNGSFNSLTTDKLIVNLDPYHNRVDNAWFEVNPAGVKGDQFNGDDSWDPIWEAAAQSDAEGW
ncbi:MAG: carbohydrate binding family 9 domain-containing protein, partial [Armatimonadetes bacterium]|nr:carbohydrate binding family 9 domain-containing protein [Armatimonadota bacterium]